MGKNIKEVIKISNIVKYYKDVCLQFYPYMISDTVMEIRVLITREFNSASTFTLENDLSFTLKISKGIGNYYDNNKIDIESILYDDGNELISYNPKAVNYIERIITIPKGTDSSYEKILKIVTNISKDENSWTLQEKQDSLNKMNYSGNIVLNGEILNPINCNLMKYSSGKHESSIRFDIYNKVNSSWPMISNISYTKSQCFRVEGNKIYIEGNLDIDLFKAAIANNLFGGYGLVELRIKYFIKDTNGFWIDYKQTVYYQDEDGFYNVFPTSEDQGRNGWGPEYRSGDVRTEYVNFSNNEPIGFEQIRGLKFVFEGTITEDRGWMPITNIVDNKGFTIEMTLTYVGDNIETEDRLIKDIVVDNRAYFRGELVPIMVRLKGIYSRDSWFSYLPHGEIVVNNKTLFPYSANYDYFGSSTLLYLYPVESNSNGTLKITKFGNGQFLNGPHIYGVTIDKSRTFNMVSVRMCEVIQSVKAEYETDTENYNNKIDITVDLNNDSKYTDYYRSDVVNINNQISKSVYSTLIDKENMQIVNENISLVYKKDQNNKYYLSGSCDINVNTASIPHEYLVKIYVKDRYSANNQTIESDYFAMYGINAILSVDPVKYVEADKLQLIIPANSTGWPSKENNIIYNIDREFVELDYKYTGDATFKNEKDFLWSVDSITSATIPSEKNQNNKYYIQPLNEGEIKVKLTALNGNVNKDANITVLSDTITIIYKTEPSIIIPKLFSNIIIVDGNDAKIMCVQNLTEINKDKDIEFLLEIYNGNYKISQLNLITTLNATRNTNSNNKNEFIIPKEILNLGPSQGQTPKYTVLLKSKNPYYETEYIQDIAYIQVLAKPIKLDLDCGEKTTYIDDSETPNKRTMISITWIVENIDKVNGSNVLFQVDRNGEILNDSIMHLDDMTTDINGNYIGSYNLEITNVNPNVLKDIYTISIKGKNNLDNVESFDSKIISVYSASSFKILINNEDRLTYDMNNYDYIQQLNLNNLSFNELQKLREVLNLKAKANIKASTFNEYEDLIMWNTSDKEKLSINYYNGAGYWNIDETIYKYFPPSREFLLSGLQDGNVTVTATHAQSNREDTVSINVKTLKDQFYLFKFNPQVLTTLNYTDGKNNKRTVTSNSNGLLALYEPNFIDSDIYVKSIYNNETYLGTIKKLTLASGEKDSTKNLLYPINIFKLRRVSVVDMYLKKEDASPYSGSVKIHGGVYKNKGYCQNALINGNSGVDGFIVQVDSNGHIRLNLDSTQFWSEELNENQYVELTPIDDLQFIFEIYFIDGGYYPDVIYINGNENADDIVKFGDAIINLRKIANKNKKEPFIVGQEIKPSKATPKGKSIRDSAKKIGPSSKQPNVYLNTDVMLWGIEDSFIQTYRLFCKDKEELGNIKQEQQLIRYPFSQTAILRNIADLSKDAIWIENLEKTMVEFNLINDDNNSIVKSIPSPSQIINMMKVEEVEKSQNVQSQLDKLKQATSIKGIEANIEDKLIKAGINILSAIGMQGTFFKMAISSTEDPSIYRVFMWAGNTDVGLNIPDSSSIVVLDQLSKGGLDVVPDISSLVSMAKGTYMKEQGDTLNKLSSSTNKLSSDKDFSVGLGGYFLAEIEFNYDITKWDMCILSGGFTATASMEYKWTFNDMVGPIPVTAYIKAGGGIGANFNVAVRRHELTGYPWANNYPGKKANDYITRINANVYIRAFAGIGFDYSVVALRIGIFGQIEVKFETALLSRNYLSDPSKRELNGQLLDLIGTIGIEFAVKILFISYETVLASVSAQFTKSFNKWDEIDNYWNNNLNELGYNDLNNEDYNDKELKVVSQSCFVESRSYLNKYERYWLNSNNRLTRSSNGLEILQQNANPSSNPRISNDGEILIYISDENSNNIEDTRICYSLKNSQGKFEQGTIIPSSSNSQFDGYGDSNPVIDGKKDFAVVAWVRLREDINLDSGSTLSDYQKLYMLNSSEVMLSIYKNNQWTTIRVTEDTSPDLSPVVATNGESVFLAWRNLYVENSKNILDFSTKDYIDFTRIDKGNLAINETRNLYNGSNGSIKGMDVSMLSDGTCCVAYVVDSSDNPDKQEYEIYYSIISSNNEIIKSVRLTNDHYTNENPKVSTVTLKSGEEKFVIAYHTIKTLGENIVSDIRLAFIDKEGTIDVDILAALSQKIGEEYIEVSGKYEFVKVSKSDNQIENLALMWTEAYLTIDEQGNQNADKDVFKVVKFIEDINENISLSAPINICTMPERTIIDAFDCYMSDTNDLGINAIILGSEYSKINLEDDTTYKIVMYEEKPIYVSNHITNMYTLESQLTNSISIESISFDYKTVKVGMPLLVLFTIKNIGLDAIKNIKIIVDNQEYNFNNLILEANSKIDLSTVYQIGNEIYNVPINIIAETIKDEPVELIDELYIDYPDVGISKVETVSEVNGIRTVRATLYNDSDCKLAKVNRKVILGVYEDVECTKLIDYVTFRNNENNQTNLNKLIIDNIDDLDAIDNGYYTTLFDFDIKSYLGEGIEITTSGLSINIKAEIKEEVNGVEYTLPELNPNNNISYCTFESLLNKYREQMTISISHQIEDNHSIGEIIIRNNSLNKIGGRLSAKLLDENKIEIESMPIDTTNIFTRNNILLNEEEMVIEEVVFSVEGKSIIVEYDDGIINNRPNVDESKMLVDYDWNEIPRKIRVDFRVEGSGMDNENPIVGDVRWVPYKYKVLKGNETCVYECYAYAQRMYYCYPYHNIDINFQNINLDFRDNFVGDIYVNGLGEYILFISFEKQVFTTYGWQSYSKIETINQKFTAVE